MTSSPLRAACLVLSVACLPVLPAMAAGSLYLDIPGLAGGSATPSRTGQIDLTSLSWGASRAARIDNGTRILDPLHVQDIAWNQAALDASTDALFSRLTTSAAIGSARFELVDARTRGQAPTLVLQAGESALRALNLVGTGAGIGVAGSLDTSSVKLTYDPEPINGPGAATHVTYDRSKGQQDPVPLTRAPLQPVGVVAARAGMYLRLGSDAGAIAGDNDSLGHENWIAIDAFSMGASLSGVQGQQRPFVQDLSWSQRFDATSTVVLARLIAGEGLVQATLEQVATDSQGRLVTVLQQALNDVLFTSFSLEIGSDGTARTQGTMSFTSYTQTHWVLLDDGQHIGPLSAGYDILNGRSMTALLASDVAGFGRGSLDGTEVFNPAPIPEPQTWALWLAGLAGVRVMARRWSTGRRD